jgi:hypothetical protein
MPSVPRPPELGFGRSQRFIRIVPDDRDALLRAVKRMTARVHEMLEEGNLIGRHDVLLLLIQAPPDVRNAYRLHRQGKILITPLGDSPEDAFGA